MSIVGDFKCFKSIDIHWMKYCCYNNKIDSILDKNSLEYLALRSWILNFKVTKEKCANIPLPPIIKKIISGYKDNLCCYYCGTLSQDFEDYSKHTYAHTNEIDDTLRKQIYLPPPKN